MRWSVFVVIQFLVVSGIVGIFYIHQDRVIVLKKPPASIAQWYKPQNKRQVWLHTMFKLRREMQAVEIYAKNQDAEKLQKWAAKLNQDYHKIAKMVPEWQNRLDLNAIAEIENGARENRYNDVADTLLNLTENCQSCHSDFRAVTATMYRAPDFSEIKIDGSSSLNSHMLTLSQQVNRIKIAFVDGRQDAALSALSELANGMDNLGGVCISCHNKGSKTYPTESMIQATAVLENSLKTGSLQDKGKALGTLAVMACAECHGTHRLSYDSKKLFTEGKSWGELLKHSF